MKEKDKVIFAKLLLKITFIMILVSVAIKLFGFNFFEADTSNKILQFVSSILDIRVGNDKVFNLIFNLLLLFFQGFIFFRLSCENKNMKVYYITASIVSTVTVFIPELFLKVSGKAFSSLVYGIFSFLVLIVPAILIDIKIKKHSKKPAITKFLMIIWEHIKKPLFIFLAMMLYQMIVMFLRNITYGDEYETIYNFLLNFDYMILLIATYYIFIKRENNLKFNADFDFALTKLLNQKLTITEFKFMVVNIKNKFTEFKKKDFEDKTVIVLYVLFFIIQELLTLGVLVYIATLNHYLIECLFILSAFIISKQVFGAFHFKSFILCFFVSNITFYALSKITMNVTLTFVIPILSGMGLAYVSSLFIKKANMTPYRGMPEKDLIKICKTKKLNKVETGILVDYYCNRIHLDKLAFKYHYSDRSIQRMKANALEKIEKI